MLDDKSICIILKRAIREDLFDFVYQPIYDLNLSRFTKIELLLRLRHKKFGYISPSEFIPVAERFGLIHRIGLRALEEACKKITRLTKLGINFEDISVNISVVQFENEYLYDDIIKIINKYNVDPHKITLEVTETATIKSIGNFEKISTSLSSIGIKLALDDFGSGYNSFSKLISIPLKYIKIDKYIISNLENNENAKSIVKCILDFSKEMNLDVIAEGIESKESLDILNNYMCRYIQGFYLSKPLPFNDLYNLLASQNL